MIRRILSRAVLTAVLGTPLLASAASSVIDVYKSASCGCCTEWVKHLKASGITVKTHNVDNPSDYREKAGIPNQLGSCHTGIVAGYAFDVLLVQANGRTNAYKHYN